MNLKEPNKKKRVRQQSQRPFPIPLNKNDEWVMYTAHLSASGTCIAHPDEMAAVYCMGSFGKGSLSRGFPSFGKRRFGAPPQVRERQWKRRKQWLEDVKKLEAEPFVFSTEGSEDLSNSQDSPKASCSSPGVPEDPKTLEKSTESIEEPSRIIQDHKNINLDSKNEENSSESEDKVKKNNSEDLEITKSMKNPQTNDEKNILVFTNEEEVVLGSKSIKNPQKLDEKNILVITNEEEVVPESKSIKNPQKNILEVVLESKSSRKIPEDVEDIDEVILDSTEDEEVCEIVDNDLNKSFDTESQDDVCVLSDGMDLKADSFLDLMELPQEKPKVNPNEMLVLPDSDSDTENYLQNVQPRVETEGFPVTETLQLTFEESFFLMYGLGCLQVVNYDGQFFSIIEAWNHFNEQDESFFSKYVVYHYFRSKGWVVKPGVKCSGDFVLYKKGPQYYHASYIVFIEVVDADSLLRDDNKTRRDTAWMNVHGLNRLAQSIAKELLIVQVLWPSTVPRNSNPVPLEALSEFTVREILMRRWNPNETCETIPLDDEDEDSDEDSS